jgi:S-methylmethionine-dependent homocysteine/selenocysteine methylase
MPKEFRDRLARGTPLLLDAALGTELARRGANTAPPLWSARALVEAPELVEAIHRENVAAGAEVITIDSFRLHRRNVRREPFLEGELNAGELIAIAVKLARRAGVYSPSKKSAMARAGPPTSGDDPPPREASNHLSKKNHPWIAGSLAPLEDCYRPDLVPDQESLDREHHEMAEALAAAGVDLILVETMNSIRELVAATVAAVSTGLPAVTSMVTDGAGRLLSGESIVDAVRILLSLRRSPDALGINCVPARILGADLARLAAAAPGVPLAAYGNTGRAVDESCGLFTDPIEPAEYAELARTWVASGARLVGGCCGTAAAHVAALSGRLRGGA